MSKGQNISFLGAYFTGSNAYSIGLSIPEDIGPGDFVFAHHLTRSSARTSGSMYVQGGGWVELGFQQASGSQSPSVKLYGKIWQSGDPTFVTFVSTGAATANQGVQVIGLTNVNSGTFGNPSNLIFGSHAQANRFSGSIGGLSTSIAYDAILIGAGLSVNTRTFQPHPKWARYYDSTFFQTNIATSQFIGMKVFPTGTADFAEEISYATGSNANYVGWKLLLNTSTTPITHPVPFDDVSHTGTNGTSLTVEVPSNTRDGDLLVAQYGIRAARADTDIFIPSGWTQELYTLSSGTTPALKIASKIWRTGDSTSEIWFVSGGATNFSVAIMRIDNFNTGTYRTKTITLTSRRNYSLATGTAEARDVDTANSLLLYGVLPAGNGITWHNPTGTIEHYDQNVWINGSPVNMMLDTDVIVNTGSVGPYEAIATSAASLAQYTAWLWAIPPIPAGGGTNQSINLNTLRVTGSAISMIVVPGARTISISTLGLTGSAISLSVVPGAVTVPISTLGLTGSAISLSVIPGAISVPISTLGLTGSAISLAVVPGAISVPISTLSLTGSALSLSVIPGAVSVGLSTLSLTGSAISLAVTSFVSVTVVLSTLGITGSAISTSVIPGTATIPLSSLGLTGSAVSMSVLPGAITTLLNTLGLTATVNDLSVYVAIAGIVPTKRIYHVGYENRVIAIEKQEEHHVGYGNRTTNIDEVE